MGKILRLRQKVTSIKDSITGLFSKPSAADKDDSSEKLDAFKGARGGVGVAGGGTADGRASGPEVAAVLDAAPAPSTRPPTCLCSC